LVWRAIEALEALEQKGISVELINIHTIKPLDEKAVIASAKKTRCVVTAEEHQMNGGLGDSVANVLARNLPTAQEFVAVNDSFGESGTPDQLMKKYGLDTEHIVSAVEKAMARKK
jgi:transketolase